MRNKRDMVAWGVLLTLCLVFFGVPRTHAQVEGVTWGQWIEENKIGFPVWTAANYVIHAPALSHRHMYVLVEAQNFTEQNILTLFTSLAAEFTVPDDLYMNAYSDREALQKVLDQANSGILCVTFADSAEGSRASRNHSIRTEPHRSGFYRADYYRFPDGREQFSYSPNLQQEHLKTVDLKHPVFTYSGDRDNDLVSAAGRGDTEAIKRFVEQDSGQELIKQAGDKAVLAASRNGQLEIVSALLNAGVVAKGEGGNAALLAASSDGSAEIVQALLEAGADANARTGREGKRLDDSALMIASLHGHKEVVEALLAKGAKQEERNRFGETASMQAAVAGFPEIVRVLASGTDVNAHDIDGNSALMLARNDRETVEALLDLGADYRLTNKEGLTPLMLAVMHYESVKADSLIARGAGRESVEAAKRYIAAPPLETGFSPDFAKEEGYRTLSEIYIKLGMKKEAVETSKQALETLGDKAHLRARLGFTYLDVGDKDSAVAQYEILKHQAAKAQNKDRKENYQNWAAALCEELNKRGEQSAPEK
jgi:ankyrin repeat protein